MIENSAPLDFFFARVKFEPVHGRSPCKLRELYWMKMTIVSCLRLFNVVPLQSHPSEQSRDAPVENNLRSYCSGGKKEKTLP